MSRHAEFVGLVCMTSKKKIWLFVLKLSDSAFVSQPRFLIEGTRFRIFQWNIAVIFSV